MAALVRDAAELVDLVLQRGDLPLEGCDLGLLGGDGVLGGTLEGGVRVLEVGVLLTEGEVRVPQSAQVAVRFPLGDYFEF